jgi:hypothetical protein
MPSCLCAIYMHMFFMRMSMLENTDGKYYICLSQVSMICFPVCHFPCRTILEDGIRHVLHEHIPEGFSWTLHILLTLVLCGSALGTSLLTSDLGTVSSLLHSSHVLNPKKKIEKKEKEKKEALIFKGPSWGSVCIYLFSTLS